MFKSTSKRKNALSTVLALLLILSLASIAVAAPAPADPAASDHQFFTMKAYALRGSQDASAKLYVTVASTDSQTPAPDSLKQVQVKVTGTDGQLVSTKVYTNVDSLGGKAVIDLGDVPLLDRISVHALAHTNETVNTEVLNAETAVTEFAVNDADMVVSKFEGYGAQMNMHLYTALQDPSRGFDHNVAPQDLGNVEGKIASLKPGLSRIFLSPDNYKAGSENKMDSFYKTVALAQNVGANVNITWWYLETAGEDMAKTDALLQDNMHKFADTLYDLIVNKGLTAVKQITIQNEPSSKKYMNDHITDVYDRSYRLIDQYLKDKGIRDRIKIVGGDLVINNQEKWFNYLADNMGDILDGWSVHIYWNYYQTWYMQDRLNGIKAIIDTIDPSKRKPLEVTEYGVRGFKFYAPKDPIMDVNPYRNGDLTATLAGYYQEGNSTGYYNEQYGEKTPVNETKAAAFQQAWFNMQAANIGITGFSKWDMYRAQYDFTYQDYSLIGYLFNPEPGQDRWPLRPAYYMTWLMANATGVDWQVLGQNGASGAKLITPFRSPNGSDLSLFAMSTDESAASISIGDLPANKSFNVNVWNADGSGKLSSAGTVTSDDLGTVTVDAPAGSLVCLTTLSLNLQGLQ